MNSTNLEQRTEDWFHDRLGNATASQFSNVMMKPNLAGYRNYLAQLVGERLTGEREETYQSSEMVWGIETEPLAREYYETLSGNQVTETGFHLHPTLRAGASPDGLVYENGELIGGIEIKCPSKSTSIQTLLDGKIPNKYKWQLVGGMLMTGAKWWDFVSFDPRLPLKLRTKIIRMERNEKDIEELEAGLQRFLSDVESLEKQLREMEA